MPEQVVTCIIFCLGLLISDRVVVLGRLKQMQIVVARNVHIQLRTHTLRMAHLAQNTAIGRGNALNGPVGAVGVEMDIHGGFAGKVNILRSNLTIFNKLLDKLFGSYKSALRA